MTQLLLPPYYRADQYTSVVAAARAAFASRINQIVGAANVVRLIVPAKADTTTTTDLSKNAATCTWDADISSRLSQQGLGYKQTFASASSQYGNMPDAAELSFTDDIFSIVTVANVTDTAASRQLLNKYRSDAVNAEYQFAVDAGDTLSLYLRDHSTSATAYRSSNAAITMGATHMFSAVCTGASAGSARANDITLAQDASTIASTANNNASYVAMEDGTNALRIGSYSEGVVFADATILMTLLCSVALSGTQLTDIKTAVNEFFGLSL